ncbi:hypothetical protein [Streptomyces sp. NPDC002176]|uniref:hypothetical protein n=1 Tax=Streptomyces sp. NPDC002176 TaxID=3364634 RepID=UPI00385149B7
MNRSVPPERLTDFVGRDHLLEEAIPQSLRSADGLCPVVLRSVLGSGATAAAVEYLHRTYPRHYVAAEWIDFGGSDEVGHLVAVAQAQERFQEMGGPALLVLDGVASPEQLSGLLPAAGTHILITCSADVEPWRGVGSVLTISALTEHDAVRLLGRYEPGLSKREAEQLAARLDHSPEALAYVGQSLSRKLSARQVLEMSHAELLRLLRSGEFCSPVDRIRAAVVALHPEWQFAQDLLLALSLIGSPVFPTRCLGRVVHMVPGQMSSNAHLPVALFVEALEVLARRGLLRFGDAGTVELLNLPRLVSLLIADSPARTRADRLFESLVIAFEAEDQEPVHSFAADLAARHMLALGPSRIVTVEGRWAMTDLIRVHLRNHHYDTAIERLKHFRATWGAGCGESWEAQVDRHLAQAYEGVGDIRKAFECAVRAVTAETGRRGPHDRRTLSDSFVATRLFGMLDPAAARLMAEGLERQQAAWLGEHDRETLRTGSLLARLELRCRLPGAAAERARQVWRAQCSAMGELDPETLETRHLLGEALEATGYAAREALICYRDARRLRSRALGKGHPATVASRDAYLRVRRSLAPDSD